MCERYWVMESDDRRGRDPCVEGARHTMVLRASKCALPHAHFRCAFRRPLPPTSSLDRWRSPRLASPSSHDDDEAPVDALLCVRDAHVAGLLRRLQRVPDDGGACGPCPRGLAQGGVSPRLGSLVPSPTLQALETTVLDRDLATLSLSVLYACFSVASVAAPKVVDRLGPRCVRVDEAEENVVRRRVRPHTHAAWTRIRFVRCARTVFRWWWARFRTRCWSGATRCRATGRRCRRSSSSGSARRCCGRARACIWVGVRCDTPTRRARRRKR